jgi:alpha-beta hydrolase superfamily lysophospholipase
MILILIGGYIGLHHIAPYAIVMPPRAECLHLTPQESLDSEKLTLQTQDSIDLKGYWIHSKQDSVRGVMILIHGIAGCKEAFLGLANDLAEQGIESILFDNRAHGESGGEYTTYGFKEKKDIAEIVDYIKSKDAELPIGIWGNSLGGAIAIQALEYDKRIEFGIVESTFTDLSQIVYDYKKRMLGGIGLRFASNMALKKAGEIADFDPAQVKPLESVKNITQPMFFAHGDSDESIKFTYGQELYTHTKSTKKEFYLVKGAGHYGLAQIGGRDYTDKIQAFLRANLTQ